MSDTFFTLPVFNDTAPLYEQLYRHFAKEIQGGVLGSGSKMPSKRRLCDALGVSMSTVESAYGLLISEGYIISKPRSGYLVSDVIPFLDHVAPPAVINSPAKKSEYKYNFSTGDIDTSLFPFASWARITKEAVYENPALLQRGHPQGDESLRIALAELLSQYRGVKCQSEQIIVGAGSDYLLGIVMQLLDEYSEIGLEDPGYPATYETVKHYDKNPVSIKVDEKGMSAEYLERSGVSLAYVTPSHQFPLGVTMTADRRSQILRWAYSAPGRYIIEDDYDSEFRYTSRPLPALQGMDKGGKVIYISTFSRSIAPSIRVAYMILPPELLNLYREKFPLAASTVSRFEQEAIRRFITQGLYGRHLRRVSNLYKRRCKVLTDSLGKLKNAEINGAGAGLHFLLTLSGLPEKEIVERAAARGIKLQPLSQYCHSLKTIESTVVLGYGGMDDEELKKAADELIKALQ